jgi:hypothetical protein
MVDGKKTLSLFLCLGLTVIGAQGAIAQQIEEHVSTAATADMNAGGTPAAEVTRPLTLPSRPAAAFPTAPGKGDDSPAPGETKSRITVIAVITVITAAIILALSHHGHDTRAAAPAPVPADPLGTILVPGTPQVSTPNR